MNKSQIPIVILNWNSFQDTKECIESVLKDTNNVFQIHLLDNNSENDQRKMLGDEFSNCPKITLKYFDKNFGFAKAHNKIFQQLLKFDFPFIFVLNNDTVLPKSSQKLIEEYSLKDNEGMVSFKMLNYWNRDLMDNAGHKMLSSGEIIPIGHGDTIQNYQHSFENIGACAGATLYSTEMLRDIGLFDEYFETGYEDAELGLRAFVAGYKSIYHPDLLVFHKMGQSIKKVFNYKYTLKIQTNIFYTYLKLMHWQVMAIHFIPFVLRFFLITIVDIIFWRPKYLKIQYHALYIILFKDFKKVMKARRDSSKLRRIPWWQLLLKQEFFLLRDIISFYKFIIKGEKSYFEK